MGHLCLGMSFLCSQGYNFNIYWLILRETQADNISDSLLSPCPDVFILFLFLVYLQPVSYSPLVTAMIDDLISWSDHSMISVNRLMNNRVLYSVG